MMKSSASRPSGLPCWSIMSVPPPNSVKSSVTEPASVPPVANSCTRPRTAANSVLLRSSPVRSILSPARLLKSRTPVVRPRREHERVGTAAAPEDLTSRIRSILPACTGNEHVVAAAAVENIATLAAHELVGPGVTQNRVAAIGADDVLDPDVHVAVFGIRPTGSPRLAHGPASAEGAGIRAIAVDVDVVSGRIVAGGGTTVLRKVFIVEVDD